MEKTKIYISAPMQGNKIIDILDYYEYWSRILTDMGYLILNPMAGKMTKELFSEWNIDIYDTLTSEHVNKLQDISVWNYDNIFSRDKWMVRYADIIFATLINPSGFTNDILSVGVLNEIAWGHILNKNVTLVIDKNNSSHRHIFITKSATNLFYNNKNIDDEIKNYFHTLITGTECQY